MYSGRFVFSQLMEFFPLPAFRHCVQRYRGQYKVQRFSCLDQFLCMAFAQLTGRESLRDIETCLRALQPKLYHVGIRANVSRTTLARANENRDWHIRIASGPVSSNCRKSSKKARHPSSAAHLSAGWLRRVATPQNSARPVSRNARPRVRAMFPAPTIAIRCLVIVLPLPLLE